MKDKQFSVKFPIEDYILIRKEAARQNISMGKLLRYWIGPHVERLKRNE